MAERDLINAFDDCITRLAHGATIEDCLRVYPDYADDLRDLLQLGQLLHQAQANGDETATARNNTRDRVTSALDNYLDFQEETMTKRKRNLNFNLSLNRWTPIAAAAAIALIIGIGIGIGGVVLLNNDAGASDVQRTATSVAILNATTGAQIKTQMPATQSNIAASPTFEPTSTFTPTFTPTSTPQPTMTMPAMPVIAATSVAQMQPAGASNAGFPVGSAALTATAPATPLARGTQVAGLSTGIAPGQNPPVTTDLQQSLNAGAIDDNADWDVYTTYRNNFLALNGSNAGGQIDDVDITRRQIIRVVDEAGQPVLGAQVAVYIASDDAPLSVTRTYATGMTLFLPFANEMSRRLHEFRVVVTKDGQRAEAILDINDFSNLLTIELPMTQPERETILLDVLFLIDSTGSMDDEIAQISNNILYIASQIDQLPDDVDIRYAWVTYKDPNFATDVFDFTPSVQAFQSTFSTIVTNGGDGETLNDGLDKALNQVQWRGDDAIKLIFLVGDEPPLMSPQYPTYAVSAREAAARGIKVHPIASSGLNTIGEYVFRQIAQLTMGHFIFLTYEGGQAGIVGNERPDLNVGQPRDPDTGIGEYTVNELHNIVLNLIRDEIAALQGQ